ncbi:hypothetical protein OAH05_01165 [bacterium]|jgi:hypothetical protein|nr:hypothetical protein [Planctomicrobium sp.]MDB4731231.1 hypothetical protein [bacterium]MDB4802515.1 hypothetical protein [bacterium]
MPDQSMVVSSDLTKKQFLFLIRKLGVFSKRPALDVSAKGDLLPEVFRRGGNIQAIVDHSEEEAREEISVGSPAGSVSQPAHSVHRILVRDSSVFSGSAISPESTIALANLLSCLKSRGKLIIPVSGEIEAATNLWNERLQGFPGKLTHREYKTGIISYLNLTFLLRGVHQIPVLEFNIEKKLISRLEWHRLAREAVMIRMQKAAA